ncbi:hypothetical protein BBP40_010658 [Aspergillus hancockii]|nr:hypothetical protein BBP40_010658 [Aspergillus hancockii]
MKRPEENKVRCLALRKIERAILDQRTTHPDLDAPATGNINGRVIPTLKPRFFQFYPDAQLGEQNPNYFAREFPEDPEDPNDNNEYVLHLFLSQVLTAYPPF